MFIFCTFIITFLLFFVSTTVHYANAQKELIVNGGFETGDFSGWTTDNLTSNGNWFVYSGTLSPISNYMIAPPPEGQFAAVTDQSYPYIDASILYQDI